MRQVWRPSPGFSTYTSNFTNAYGNHGRSIASLRSQQRQILNKRTPLCHASYSWHSLCHTLGCITHAMHLQNMSMCLTWGRIEQAPAGPPTVFIPDEGHEQWPIYLQLLVSPLSLCRMHRNTWQASPVHPKSPKIPIFPHWDGGTFFFGWKGKKGIFLNRAHTKKGNCLWLVQLRKQIVEWNQCLERVKLIHQEDYRGWKKKAFWGTTPRASPFQLKPHLCTGIRIASVSQTVDGKSPSDHKKPAPDEHFTLWFLLHSPSAQGKVFLQNRIFNETLPAPHSCFHSTSWADSNMHFKHILFTSKELHLLTNWIYSFYSQTSHYICVDNECLSFWSSESIQKHFRQFWS